MAPPSAFRLTVCLVAFSSLGQVADASAFLRGLPDQAATQSVSPELEKALLAEIEEVLGSDHRRATEGRLGRIEAALRPTFDALPKNAHGRLGHAAVRYAMHRLFVQRHAWFVRGLEPGGGASNASSATAIFEGRLPEYVQSLFERRMGASGFGLHELAVLAATLENLVHHETMQRLRHTYRILERSIEDPLSLEESQEVADAYMMSYVLGLNFTSLTPAQAKAKHSRIKDVYPTWPDTQKFVREAQSVLSPREEYTFENMASVVEEIFERYGHWQDSECRALKNELIAMEDRGTGRVRLVDFYGAAVHEGKWQFSETVSYLRSLGALDESDPDNVRVLIANYIMSPSNCVASSSYYTVCCLDDCEQVLSHLEEKLGTYDATPGEIASLVAFLPSATVSGNRTLSTTLQARLADIAEHHGGRIPLHGRLFAQWMHQAYPRECPYPHVTGTTNPQRAEDYKKATGERVTASKDVLRQYVGTSPRERARSEEEAEEYGMWTMEEELVIHHEAPVEAAPRSSLAGSLRGLLFLAALVSTAVTLIRLVGSSARSAGMVDVRPKVHQATLRLLRASVRSAGMVDVRSKAHQTKYMV